VLKIQDAKKSPKIRRRTTLSGCVFATEACIDNRIRNLLNSNTFSTCPHNMVNFTNGLDRFVSLGYPSKFQRVSRLIVITAATSLTGGQPNFARCLAVSWVGTVYIYIYIHFRGLLPLREFCQVQNSLCVQVLRSLLAALLHGNRALGVSQILRRSEEGATYIRQGGHHVGHRPAL